MYRKITLRLLAVLAAVFLLFNVVYHLRPEPLRFLDGTSFGRALLAPSMGLSRGTAAFSAWLARFSSLVDANERNAELAKRNEMLAAENHLLKHRLDGTERLLGLERYRQKYPFSIEVSRVIGRNPQFWHQHLILDGGKDRGFEPGMPVITKDGLAGRLVEVYNDSSRMLLIIDPEFSVDVRGERSRVLALCSGIGTSVMKINYLPRFEDLTVGEVMTTSGLDGGFPEGLPVGYVVEVNKPFGAYFLDAYVIPVIDVLKLTEVMVIKEFRKKK